MHSRDTNPECISSENIYSISISDVSRKFQDYLFSQKKTSKGLNSWIFTMETTSTLNTLCRLMWNFELTIVVILMVLCFM